MARKGKNRSAIDAITEVSRIASAGRGPKRSRDNSPENKLNYLGQRAIRRARGCDREYDPRLPELISENPPTNCCCCGVILLYKAEPNDKSGKDPRLVSLDRVDNSRGYTIQNTRVICLGCNTAKSATTLEMLRLIVRYIERETGLKS